MFRGLTREKSVVSARALLQGWSDVAVTVTPFTL